MFLKYVGCNNLYINGFVEKLIVFISFGPFRAAFLDVALCGWMKDFLIIFLLQ